MDIVTRPIRYSIDDLWFDAVMVTRDDTRDGTPTVLVLHGIEGRSDAQLDYAKKIAELGYQAIAVDVFGEAASAGGMDATTRAMEGFLLDRIALRQRLSRVFDAVTAPVEVDSDAVVAAGFCFGGLCVLDLARAGHALVGAVSFHGLLTPPPWTGERDISAKTIVFHGWDDPFAPPEDVVALGRELTARGADWQLHAYGNTMHAFMAPFADAPERGIQYSATAAARAWESFVAFLSEAFGRTD